ncbi:hypothetical protein LY78DRAFT_652710 [Colletotrichum sublineola]|nr:hypothetical protein LY78DRAFT_652710 [Colletotrichum sublineola]
MARSRNLISRFLGVHLTSPPTIAACTSCSLTPLTPSLSPHHHRRFTWKFNGIPLEITSDLAVPSLHLSMPESILPFLDSNQPEPNPRSPNCRHPKQEISMTTRNQAMAVSSRAVLGVLF